MARLRKRDYRTILTRIILVIVLTGVTFLFARGAVRMYDRYREASSGSATAQQQLRELQARKLALEKDTDRLSSHRGLEEELRKRYGVALPGEGVIEIQQPQGTTSQEKRPGLVKKWLNWLF